MLFDSAILHAVAAEVRQRWLGRRVQRVQQSTYREIGVVVSAAREVSGLQIVIAPDAARAHLVAELHSFGDHPPPFCMALRKHLRGAVVADVRQPDFDRILRIQFAECEGFGPACRRTLVAEIMGRYSNVVLLDEQDTILACAKHITSRVNRYRETREGIPYVGPPTGERLDPLTATAADLRRRLEDAGPGSSAADWVRRNTMGASTVWVAEALWRADVEPDAQLTEEAVARLAGAFCELNGELQASAGQAVTHHRQGMPPIIYPIGLRHLTEAKITRSPSISAAIVALSSEESVRHAAEQLRNQVLQAVKSALQAAEKRRGHLQTRLDAAGDADRIRLCGDAILANLADIEPRSESIELPNPADPEGSMLRIELHPGKSPSENAQAYFRRYKKAKQTAVTTPVLLGRVEQDIEYLGGVRFAAESAECPEDLREIREELQRQGTLRLSSRARGKSATTGPPNIGRTTSSDGLTILYGRNNRQNEYLLRHEARPDDLWLHVRNAPSAHVVIKAHTDEEDIPERTLLEAAAIAAAHSVLRDSTSVEVDYTLRKHVRKLKGARPGFVTYRNFRTVAVKPTSNGP